MKYRYLLFFLTLTILSCQKQSNKDANDIRSLLINDDYASYFRVPNSYKHEVDSSRLLINNKYRVLLETEFDTLRKIMLNNEYKDAFKECSIIEKNDKIVLEDLVVNDKIHLQKATKSAVKNFRGNFNVYISFSQVLFNKERNKAVVLMGVAYSSLNGSYDICFLQKVNGVWRIKGYQNMSIS